MKQKITLEIFLLTPYLASMHELSRVPIMFTCKWVSQEMKNVPRQLAAAKLEIEFIFGSTCEQNQMSNSWVMLINSQVKFAERNKN